MRLPVVLILGLRPHHSQSTTHSLGRNNQSKLCFELFDPAFDGFCSNGFDSQVTNDPSIIIYEYKLHFHWVVQSKQMGMNWQMYLDVAPFTVLIELADNPTPIDASQASPGITKVIDCHHKGVHDCNAGFILQSQVTACT